MVAAAAAAVMVVVAGGVYNLSLAFFPAINMRGRFVVTLLWDLTCAASCAVLRAG